MNSALAQDLEMPLGTFLAHAYRALWKKAMPQTEAEYHRIHQAIRAMYGVVIALSKTHPALLRDVSVGLDKAPSGMRPAWYVGYVRQLVAESRSELAREVQPRQSQPTRLSEVLS